MSNDYPSFQIRKDVNLTMKEYLIIGPTPNDEECTQINECIKDELAENNAYARQLIRMHGEPPDGASVFILKNTGHDVGIYHEVAVMFEEDIEAAAEYAFLLEEGCEKWDEEALKELRTTKTNISKTILKVASKNNQNEQSTKQSKSNRNAG